MYIHIYFKCNHFSGICRNCYLDVWKKNPIWMKTGGWRSVFRIWSLLLSIPVASKSFCATLTGLSLEKRPLTNSEPDNQPTPIAGTTLSEKSELTVRGWNWTTCYAQNSAKCSLFSWQCPLGNQPPVIWSRMCSAPARRQFIHSSLYTADSTTMELGDWTQRREISVWMQWLVERQQPQTVIKKAIQKWMAPMAAVR